MFLFDIKICFADQYQTCLEGDRPPEFKLSYQLFIAYLISLTLLCWSTDCSTKEGCSLQSLRSPAGFQHRLLHKDTHEFGCAASWSDRDTFSGKATSLKWHLAVESGVWQWNMAADQKLAVNWNIPLWISVCHWNNNDYQSDNCNNREH